MMETVIVLFIFFIILGISLIFLFQMNQSSTEKLIRTYEQNDLYNFLLEIPNTPQIQCSFLGSQEECLDSIKLLTPLEEKIYGRRKITVELINTQTPILCTSATYPNCNTFNLYDNRPNSNVAISTPIAIYYPINNEYKPGILRIIQ